jgi:hypothetical protein
MCSACQFIDWDTWMNVAAVVVAYKEDQEFAMVRMKNQQAGTLTFPQGFRELGGNDHRDRAAGVPGGNGTSCDQSEIV